MSATLPTQNVPRPATEIIWSRGGQCFRRLVWKETSEAVGLWCLIESMALVSGYLIDFRTLDSISMPLLICHAAPAIFALLFGARAFAHEVEHGTWELLRSVGASARDVLGAKWLVGAVGSLSILSLNVSMLAAMHQSRLYIAQIGEPTLWYALIVLLTLAVSLHVSLRSRNELTSTAISTVLSMTLWLPWTMCFDRFSELTWQYRWTCNAVLSDRGRLQRDHALGQRLDRAQPRAARGKVGRRLRRLLGGAELIVERHHAEQRHAVLRAIGFDRLAVGVAAYLVGHRIDVRDLQLVGERERA